MKILITGANGYIGKSLYSYLKNQHDVSTINREDCDLSNSTSVNRYFKNKFFDIVIHCAIKGGNRLIKDTAEVTDINLRMYYNLLEQKNSYNKFICFGSGAEIYNKDTPYGISKHIIRQSILEKSGFYNLRIFGVFDENELETRFIKSNINRYINRQSLQIYEDKYMDFIYMKDLIKIVDYYIDHNIDKLPKEINCCYNTVYTLSKIAQIINDLDDYKVEIEIHSSNSQSYTSTGVSIYVDFIGLANGIKLVYEKLKNAK